MQEELDLALALSASEYTSQLESFRNRNTQMECDAALARSLEEQERKAAGNGYGRGGAGAGGSASSGASGSAPSVKRSSPSITFSKLQGLPRQEAPAPKGCCYKCRKDLTYGTKMTAMDRTYCEGCFCCEGCHAPLDGQFFPHAPPSLGAGQQAEVEPFCSVCVRELFSPKCCVCSHFLEGRFLKHPVFEDEKYCVIHHDQRKVCFSCARLEPAPTTGREQFIELPDGRASCAKCIMTAVLDSTEARPLFLEAVDFMEREIGLQIPPEMRNVPVLAVDLPSLNEHKAQSATKRTSTVRGLTVYTTSTVRHVEPGHYIFDPVRQLFTVVKPLAPTHHTVSSTDSTREVNAVLVLFGLPRDLTASILAHEAMHVYFKLSRHFPADLSPFAEEGMCQYIAAKYLKWRELQSLSTTVHVPSKEERTRDDSLRKYFQYSIHADASHVYGDGFRAAEIAVNALGMSVVLEHIREEKQLPSV